MATAGRRSDLDLETDELLRRRLAKEAPGFDFFQAVRLLQQLEPDREDVGRFVSPAREAVRFTANSSLGFPASELQQIEFTDGAAARMKVNFMGLTGPEGVLPHCYTEFIIERLQGKDRAAADFLDIFNHRIISLFFRAWEKYRFEVDSKSGARGCIAESLLSLVGLRTRGLQNRQPVPDEALLYYAGLLEQRPRSATVLRQLLSDYFDVQVQIEQFAGAWFALDPESQTQLDDGPDGFTRLGGGAVVGDAIWSEQSMVRIRLGPLTMERYLDFLPSGSAYSGLCALTRFFSGDEIEFELQLVLKREEVPPPELGVLDDSGPRLGWITWMKSVPLGRDPADTILKL